MSVNDRISVKQRRAIAAVLSERSLAKAAATVGVGESTLRRWLRQDEFVAALRAEEAELTRALSRRLSVLAGSSLEAVESALSHDSASLRLRAAALVLDNLLKMKNLADFEERLSRLEATLYERQSGKETDRD